MARVDVWRSEGFWFGTVGGRAGVGDFLHKARLVTVLALFSFIQVSCHLVIATYFVLKH